MSEPGVWSSTDALMVVAYDGVPVRSICNGHACSDPNGFGNSVDQPASQFSTGVLNAPEQSAGSKKLLPESGGALHAAPAGVGSGSNVGEGKHVDVKQCGLTLVRPGGPPGAAKMSPALFVTMFDLEKKTSLLCGLDNGAE